VHILYHVAEALTEAHDVGLIHRDIKPANVILCRQGGIYDFPKVVDFGLVKDLERGGGDLTRADVVAGTPLYLAPEAINAPDTLSGQSDLYSLGAVGYFALTGSSVFRGKTLVEVCSHHLHTAPEPPSKRLDRAVPADLEALILECLAKDPTERPAGAHELRRRLEACEGFGGWTGDQARAWWQERGEALATAPQVIEETDLPDGVRFVVGAEPEEFDGAPLPDVVFDCWSGPRRVSGVLSRVPDLEWFHSRSAGLDGVLVPELAASPAIVTNGRGAFSHSLAEFVLAALLFFAKDLRRMNRSQESGTWDPFDPEMLHGPTTPWWRRCCRWSVSTSC
jgi:hypothetical protein